MAEIGVLGRGEASRSSRLPWTQLFVESLGVAPLWGGLALAAAQLGFVLAWKYLAGDPLRVLPDAIFALLVGYSPAASVYARRASVDCLADLRPALDVAEARFAGIVEEVTRWDPFWARINGAMAVVGGLVILLNEPRVEASWPPGQGLILLVWMNLAAIWLGTRAIGHEIIVSRRFGRLGRDHAVVDVLDQRPLTPFARRGVQGALVPILMISIFSLLFVSGDAGDAVPFTQVFVVTIAAVSLLIPVHGVHRRLADQKRRRLARVAEAVRDAEEPVLAARPGQAADAAAHLHALLALRGQLEGAREWPWDLSTLVRFALYVAIGLGSWLGGALVERVVDLVLG